MKALKSTLLCYVLFMQQHVFNFKNKTDYQRELSKFKVWPYLVNVQQTSKSFYDLVRRQDFWLFLLFPNQKAAIMAIFLYLLAQHSLHSSVKALKIDQRRIELFFWTMKSAFEQKETSLQNKQYLILQRRNVTICNSNQLKSKPFKRNVGKTVFQNF